MDQKHLPSGASDRTSRRALLLGLVVLAILLASKLTAPDDFDSHDQAKQGLYVVDAWQNGHWLVPMELGQFYPTKPPLMTWMSLGAAVVQGHVTQLGARWPSFLAAALALFATVRFARRFGPLAGLATALAFVANEHVVACAMLARTDMLLCAATTFSVAEVFESYAAFREESPEARARGQGWRSPARRRFVLAAALAGVGTVAKSPVALACPVFALAAFALLEPRARSFVRAVVLPSLPLAIPVYLLTVGAWFVPAALTAGPEFVKTLLDELLGHVAGTGAYAAASKAKPFLYPFGHLASRFMPWTLLPVAAWVGTPPLEGLVGSRRAESVAADARRFTVAADARRFTVAADARRFTVAADARRFTVAALLGSLVFFGLMKVKRPDHVLPCYPWAACLAGVVFDDWVSGRLPRRAAALISVLVRGVGVVAFAFAAVFLPLVRYGDRLLALVPASVIPLDKRPLLILARESFAQRPALVLGAALAAVPLGAVVWAGARGRRPGITLTGMAAFLALVLFTHDHGSADSLLTDKGEAIPSFAARVQERAHGRRVAVHFAPPSVLFFLGESQPFAFTPARVRQELEAGSCGVVTAETFAHELEEAVPGLVPVCWSAYFNHNDIESRLVLLVHEPDASAPEDPARGAARVWWSAP